MGRDCDLWLWDGTAEYEGVLTKLEAGSFTVRVRPVKAAGGPLGRRRATSSSMDLHRLFTQHRFLAHAGRPELAPLMEACIQAVQICGDGEFDYLLIGRLVPIDPRELERLAKLPPARAAELFQKRAS